MLVRGSDFEDLRREKISSAVALSLLKPKAVQTEPLAISQKYNYIHNHGEI